MRKILLFMIIFSPLRSFAQNKTTDSLKKALDNYKKDDTIKVGMFYNYSGLLLKTDKDGSIQYAYKGIQVANKLNRPDFVASGDLMLSFFYSADNKNDSAVFVALDGLAIAERLHLNNLMPDFYSQLGDNYRLLHNYDQAEYYDNKYLVAANAKRNDTTILKALVQLISLYGRDEGRYDKVKYLMNRALPLARTLKDEYSVGRILSVKGRECYDLNEYKQSINNYREALGIWKNIKDYPNMAYSLVLISECFLEMNNKDSVGWYAYAALDTAKKYHLRKETRDAYQALLGYHYHSRDYKKALGDKFMIDSLQNEVENAQTGQTILRAEMKYDQEKRDLLASLEQAKKEAAARRAKNWEYGIIAAFVVLATFLLYNNRQKQRAKIKIEMAYSELKTTQAQLIQSEKMASLGELTAGIAHEIQNPLNFVNNFSEVNKELLDEMNEKIQKGNYDEVKALAKDVTYNEEKINHHGKRADAIVKGMLEHSRSGTGQKQLININAIAGECLRLSYHALRAKDKSFQATLQTDFDESIEKFPVIQQDMVRVLVNLFNNSFYSVNEKRKQQKEEYEPMVSVSTKRINDKSDRYWIEIRVKDNGNGIPKNIVDKIFQPFFTTKPTGYGTGLGLSLSYDIVKAHGGTIKAETKEGEFAEFIIKLPSH